MSIRGSCLFGGLSLLYTFYHAVGDCLGVHVGPIALGGFVVIQGMPLVIR